MTSRERAIMYSSLVVLAVVNASILLGQFGSAAGAAQPQDAALGPADRVILSGDPQLSVANAEGRLAWGDNAHSRAYAIGLVDVNKVIESLLEMPQYRDEREQLTEQIKAEREDWIARQATLEEQYRDMTPDDPRAAEAQRDFSAFQAEAQQWNEGVQNQINTMAVEQMERGYREMIEAVEVVSARDSIDLVLRFTPPEEPLPADLSGQTMLDIRLRPVVKAPEGLDITLEVMEELGLTVE